MGGNDGRRMVSGRAVGRPSPEKPARPLYSIKSDLNKLSTRTEDKDRPRKRHSEEGERRNEPALAKCSRSTAQVSTRPASRRRSRSRAPKRAAPATRAGSLCSGVEFLGLLEELLDLEHFGLARELEAGILQSRPHALAKGVQLLSRIPDFTDLEVPFLAEENMHLQAVGWPVSALL